MPTRRSTNAIAYWLIPAKAERELFREIIRILAEQLGAAQFEPHLTLLVTANNEELPGKVLKRIKASPVRLTFREIGWSETFTKTLFARFESRRALQRLASALTSDAAVIRDPHVSLLYKELPTATKKELARTIRLPFRTVTFDAVQAVRCALPTRTRSDVEGWRALARRQLR
jgi:hypothetical protein